jgi:putative transposase
MAPDLSLVHGSALFTCITSLLRWTCRVCSGRVAVTRKVRRFSGGVYDLGLHVVWCPKYRRPVLGGVPEGIPARTKKHRAAARKVARLHAKIRRQRADDHHKKALALVQEHDVIGHEKLNTAGMTKAPAPKPDPEQSGAFLPNGAAAKAGLNRRILDAGWGQFLSILADKAESAGRRVIEVDARNTSRTCPAALGGCGHVAKENRVTQAKFECVNCGLVENADRVGALNVLHRAGLVLCDGA